MSEQAFEMNRMAPSTDRDLLLGELAVHTGFLSRAALDAALKAREKDPSLPLPTALAHVLDKSALYSTRASLPRQTGVLSRCATFDWWGNRNFTET